MLLTCSHFLVENVDNGRRPKNLPKQINLAKKNRPKHKSRWTSDHRHNMGIENQLHVWADLEICERWQTLERVAGVLWGATTCFDISSSRFETCFNHRDENDCNTICGSLFPFYFCVCWKCPAQFKPCETKAQRSCCCPSSFSLHLLCFFVAICVSVFLCQF